MHPWKRVSLVAGEQWRHLSPGVERGGIQVPSPVCPTRPRERTGRHVLSPWTPLRSHPLPIAREGERVETGVAIPAHGKGGDERTGRYPRTPSPGEGSVSALTRGELRTGFPVPLHPSLGRGRPARYCCRERATERVTPLGTVSPVAQLLRGGVWVGLRRKAVPPYGLTPRGSYRRTSGLRRGDL